MSTTIKDIKVKVKRKGAGARKRDAEKYRYKKNLVVTEFLDRLRSLEIDGWLTESKHYIYSEYERVKKKFDLNNYIIPNLRVCQILLTGEHNIFENYDSPYLFPEFPTVSDLAVVETRLTASTPLPSLPLDEDVLIPIDVETIVPKGGIPHHVDKYVMFGNKDPSAVIFVPRSSGQPVLRRHTDPKCFVNYLDETDQLLGSCVTVTSDIELLNFFPNSERLIVLPTAWFWTQNYCSFGPGFNTDRTALISYCRDSYPDIRVVVTSRPLYRTLRFCNNIPIYYHNVVSFVRFCTKHKIQGYYGNFLSYFGRKSRLLINYQSVAGCHQV